MARMKTLRLHLLWFSLIAATSSVILGLVGVLIADGTAWTNLDPTIAE